MSTQFGSSIEQQGLPQRLWDIPRFAREASEFSATADLAPTATTPAQWSLWSNANSTAYVFSIRFSTDTAIKISLGRTVTNPNLGTNTTPNSLNLIATGSNMNTKAAVIAAIAPATALATYFCQANSVNELLAPAWIAATPARGLILTTSLVAANASLQFYWCESTS